MHSLPLFVKLDGRRVILVGAGPAAEAKRILLERCNALIVGEDEEAALAIVAIEDDAEAKAAVDRLRARGLLINAVDRPELCDVMMPAIVERDPVIVAIGTGGASAGLAKSLRQRIERMLPSSLGTLAGELHAIRGTLERSMPDADDRRRALDRALDESGALDPLIPHKPGAAEKWARRAGHGSAHGSDQSETLHLRSLNPDDLTIAETLLLGRADRLFLAPGVPDSIAHRARADAERIRAKKLPADPGPGLSVFIAAP